MYIIPSDVHRLKQALGGIETACVIGKCRTVVLVRHSSATRHMPPSAQEIFLNKVRHMMPVYSLI